MKRSRCLRTSTCAHWFTHIRWVVVHLWASKHFELSLCGPSAGIKTIRVIVGWGICGHQNNSSYRCVVHLWASKTIRVIVVWSICGHQKQLELSLHGARLCDHVKLSFFENYFCALTPTQIKSTFACKWSNYTWYIPLLSWENNSIFLLGSALA